MAVQLLEPNLVERITDKEGRLTIEGVLILQRILEALRDHEARITTLEP